MKKEPVVTETYTKKLKQMEADIGRLEREEQKLMQRLETLVYGTPEYQKTVQKLAATQMDLSIRMQEWEKMLSESKA